MREMALVWEAGFRGFPPRLPEQPIFYPVLGSEYAVQIARDWNTKQEPFAGYVTRFSVEDNYASRFEVRVVGGRQHRELWVPAEELPVFNSHLEGLIEVEAAYFGLSFRGFIPSKFGLAGRDAYKQFQTFAATREYAPMDFYLETRANELAVYLNFPFWLASTAAQLGVSEPERTATLDGIRGCWSVAAVRAPLLEVGTRAA
jgi:hypothetical protein